MFLITFWDCYLERVGSSCIVERMIIDYFYLNGLSSTEMNRISKKSNADNIQVHWKKYIFYKCCQVMLFWKTTVRDQLTGSPKPPAPGQPPPQEGQNQQHSLSNWFALMIKRPWIHYRAHCTTDPRLGIDQGFTRATATFSRIFWLMDQSRAFLKPELQWKPASHHRGKHRWTNPNPP